MVTWRRALIGFAAFFGWTAAASAGTVTGVSLSARTIVAGSSVSVTVTGTNPCGAAHIIYGDGVAITYPIYSLPVTQAHVYNAAGTYTVTAKGMGNCDGEASAALTVTAPPAQSSRRTEISDVEMSPNPARVGQPMAVIVRGSGMCAYDVQYGDGASDHINGRLPQDTHHTYSNAGTYTVIVKPAAPCAGKFSQVLQVTDTGAQQAARITHVVASPERGVTGESIVVAVHGTGTCPYDVYYGDGTAQQVDGTLPQDTHHAYTKPGTYTIVVKPQPPCEGNRSETVQIAGAAAQTPRINRVLVAPTPAAVGQPVAITIEGTGTCSYTIDYDDGNWDSRSIALPDAVRHVYSADGLYTVTAIADPPCAGSARSTFRVERR